MGVFFFGNEIQFFAQRQIHIGLDVAGCPGIAIPVPGTAKIAAFFDQTNASDTGLGKAGPSE